MPKLKPKILFFIETLQCGGAEKSLVSLLQLIDYSRVDVDLMLLHDGGLFQTYLPQEVNVLFLPQSNGLRHLLHRVCMSAFSLSLRLGVGKNRHGAEHRWSFERHALTELHDKYDVAIAYQQGFPTYYISTLLKAGKKVAWVNTDLKSAGYSEAFNRKYYDLFDRVVCVSDKLYQDMQRSKYAKPDKLSVVYDILNVKLINQMAADDSIVRGIDLHGLVLVTVGRMSPAKNYPLAVDAARLLKRRGFDFTWILVGGGSELPKIRDMIVEYGLEDYVITVGEQPNPYPFMRAADIYVHTASFEGYGLTIAEAKILGKPVVSTNFTVVYDQITDGVNGLIAEMTPESVADKIMLLASDDKLREIIVENVKNEKNTTYETEIKKFYSLIY